MKKKAVTSHRAIVGIVRLVGTILAIVRGIPITSECCHVQQRVATPMQVSNGQQHLDKL